MSETLVLPKETSQALTELTGEPRLDLALTVVIRDYARRKLQELAQQIQQYEIKYGMSFDEYRMQWENQNREQDYSYEAETDFLQWEALVTQHTRLSNSYSWMP
jgi:hypothetical protein